MKWRVHAYRLCVRQQAAAAEEEAEVPRHPPCWAELAAEVAGAAAARPAAGERRRVDRTAAAVGPAAEVAQRHGLFLGTVPVAGQPQSIWQPMLSAAM